MPRPPGHAVTAIEERAEAQYRLFSAAQAFEAGVSRRMLNHHGRPDGRWQPVVRGVWCVPPADPTFEYLCMAAQLALPGTPPLSHRAAAGLLGLDGLDCRRLCPEFIVERQGRHHRWAIEGRQVLTHRRLVAPTDVIWTGPLLHTGPLQTLGDLGTVEPPDLLEHRVESALRLGLVDEGQLWKVARLAEIRDGGRLEIVLVRRGRGAPATESYLETVAVQVIRTCEKASTPVRQYLIVVDGRVICRLDLAWPAIRLYAEVDGRAFHDIDDASFHRERWRQRQLTALGWAPAPLTARDLLRNPVATAREIDRIYVARAAEFGLGR